MKKDTELHYIYLPSGARSQSMKTKYWGITRYEQSLISLLPIHLSHTCTNGHKNTKQIFYSSSEYFLKGTFPLHFCLMPDK